MIQVEFIWFVKFESNINNLFCSCLDSIPHKDEHLHIIDAVIVTKNLEVIYVIN